jgi:hypothetical protein
VAVGRRVELRLRRSQPRYRPHRRHRPGAGGHALRPRQCHRAAGRNRPTTHLPSLRLDPNPAGASDPASESYGSKHSSSLSTVSLTATRSSARGCWL